MIRIDTDNTDFYDLHGFFNIHSIKEQACLSLPSS